MANIDQSKLTPAQQAALFQMMKAAGQQPTSGGMSQDTPDIAAQQGTGPADAGDIGRLFGNAPQAAPQPASQLLPQPGDKMHPEDAMNAITNHLMNAENVAGPKLPGSTGPQLTYGSKGQLQAMMPVSQPILAMFGIKHKQDITTPNFYQSAKAAGVDKLLPGNLALTPDGTPFVGPETFKAALEAHRITVGQGKEIYNTLDQLTSQGLGPDDARKLLAANPTGVTSKEVGTLLSKGRLDAATSMAQSRATLAGVSKLSQLMKVGGFDAAQPAAEVSVKMLGSINRAQAIIDQIMQAGGVADQRQRADLAAALGYISGNSSGPLTDERMKQFIPDSYKNKVANFGEALINERIPIDFTGFLPQFQDALTREKQANQGIADAAQQLGIKLLAQTNPQGATAINNVRATNPLVGTPPPPVKGKKSLGAIFGN